LNRREKKEGGISSSRTIDESSLPREREREKKRTMGDWQLNRINLQIRMVHINTAVFGATFRLCEKWHTKPIDVLRAHVGIRFCRLSQRDWLSLFAR